MKPEKIKSFLSSYYHVIVIIVVLLIFSLCFFHYIKYNTAIPVGDALNHSSLAARVFRSIKGEQQIWHIRDLQYPPLIYLISCLFFKIFGFEPRNALITQYIFSLVFLLSLYGLGRYMGGKPGGITSLLFGSICPHFIIWGRRYLLDMPVAAMVLLSLFLLVKSDKFRNTGYSILFGIATALSLWIKWSCVVFILPPMLILFIIQGIRNWKSGLIFLFSVIVSASLGLYYMGLGKAAAISKVEGSIVITRFHYILFLSVLLSLLVIFSMLRIIFRKRFKDEKGKILGSAFNGAISIFLAQVLVYPVYLLCIKPYFVHFIKQKEYMKGFEFGSNLMTNLYSIVWSFPLATLFIIVGIVFVFVTRRNILESGLLFSSLIVGLILTTASSPAARRYTLPVVGICIVFGGYWVGLVKKWLSIPLISILFVFAMLPYYSYFHSTPVLPEVLPVGTGREIMAGYLFNPVPCRIPLPDRGDYHLKDVITGMTEHYQKYLKGRTQVDIITIKPTITGDFGEFSRKNNSREVRDDFLDFALEYYKDGKEHYYVLYGDAAEYVKKNPDPIYVIMFYVEPVEIGKLSIDVKRTSKRELWEVFSSSIPGNRRIGLVYIHLFTEE
ncbi:MAG: glycosyltransferase family 39 protein [Candidatus Eremiobacteraeota bacterium]|nr:glycosyltransferase family 39 protein [Candidatus Eremiobacteraeota bacterium]